jgi:cytochrome c oxidase subunit 2
VLFVPFALVFTGAALAGNGGFGPLDPASPNAQRISNLYWLIFAITGGVFVLVEGALLLFVFRFRGRGRPREAEGPQVIGHSRLEVIWTVTPVVILAVIATVVLYKLPGIQDVPSASASGSRQEVRVEGHQFYWRYVYPDGGTAFDHLVAPLDAPVRLTIVSPDVAHSWWAPRLAGKTDAIPGKVNHLWFRAKKSGFYDVRCAELCGIQHAVMKGTVQIVSQEEYDRYLAVRRASSRDLGTEIYTGVCAKCHGLAGEGGIGPQIAGGGAIKDRDQLERLIRNGQNLMPAVGKDWTDREVDAVIDFVQRELAEAPK